MKISDLECGATVTLEVRHAVGDKFPAGWRVEDEVFLARDAANGVALLCCGKVVVTPVEGGSPRTETILEAPPIPVEGSNPRMQTLLDALLEKNLPRLCWLARRDPRTGPAAVLVVQAHQFHPIHHLWPDAFDMGFDDRIVDTIRARHQLTARTPEDLVKEVAAFLTERLLLPPAPSTSSPRALVSAAPDRQTRSRSGFRLYGSGLAADLERTSEGKLVVRRVVAFAQPRHAEERQLIALAEAPFRFCDETLATQVRGQARTDLDRKVGQADSYLRVWREYNSLERGSIWRQAREFGSIRYQGWRLEEGAHVFQLVDSEDLDEQLRELQSGEEVQLEAAAAEPAEFTAPPENPTETAAPRERQKTESFVGRCDGRGVNPAKKRLRLLPMPAREDEEINPPQTGFLFQSLNGDRRRLQRRDQAEERIRTASCPLPQLGLLLEGTPVPVGRRPRVSRVPKKIRDLLGPERNESQEQALLTALNTPDIALIQGPPGTGKTRMIAALLAWLAETSSNPDGVAGQVLLTSYQNSAVENVVSRTEVFGLPAVKVDRPRHLTDGDSIDRWRREQIDKMRALLHEIQPEMPGAAVLRDVKAEVVGFALEPIDALATSRLLQRILARARDLLPGELRDRLQERVREKGRLAAGATATFDDDRERLLAAVRGLRIESAGFGDDGPQQAYRALRLLEPKQLLEPTDADMLRHAADWDEPLIAPPFLAELLALKERLLDRLQVPAVPVGAAAPDADTQQLLAQVVDALNDQVRRSPSGVGEVLADYLHDLQTDPDGVRDTLQAYTVVLAATCQHAAPDYQPMARARGEDSGRPSDLVFDTVVVDEAARANPLDLFIPMARASRRIILVGDHRQLPHILEPGIERDLEKTVLVQTRENLRRSLFERLFAQLRDWEKRDDIRRTVTLDTQYRMHPDLGAFVSRTFYEHHGEPKIKAGRPAADFVHELPGYVGKVAQWVDVPNDGGNGEVGRKGKARPAEARWIARELKRLAEHSPHLSFGVITFYRAQVTALWRELSAPDVGIAEKVEFEEGDFKVDPNWCERPDEQGHLIEHIRVGTVDAFQGMEFDVVFLSVTRSNRISPTDESRRRQKYGHLMLENRACVAMSRQKRLLIVVGDRAMLEGDVAAEAVRPLVQFHRDLCGGAHVVAH